MPANVYSIPAIRDFRASVLKFQHEATTTLQVVQMELQRVIAWIEQDRPAYWNSQVRRAFDKVAETRTTFTNCQMRTVAGRRASCIEEKKAYEQARRRLQHCHDQIELVQRWATKLRREIDEFRGRMGATQRLLESGIPRTTALLDRTLNALESYADMLAPNESETPPDTQP